MKQRYLLLSSQPCIFPQVQQGHVINSSQWAVSRSDLCPFRPKYFSMWSLSSPSLAKTICKPHVKTTKSQKSQQLVSLTHCPGEQPMHTDIYVNKKSVETSGLICYRSLAYSTLSWLLQEVWAERSLFQSVINKLGPFTRISWINREIFQSFLRQVSVQLHYFISSEFTDYYHT